MYFFKQKEEIMVSENFELDLSYFYGTEHWYRHPIYQSVTYTDGVKYVAEKCDAYWLVDLFCSTYVTYAKQHYFQTYDLVVDLAQKSAVINVGDGNGEMITTIGVEYTDFPVENITIWGVDNVLLLPSEY
jgi:hypothetical protein